MKPIPKKLTVFILLITLFLGLFLVNVEVARAENIFTKIFNSIPSVIIGKWLAKEVVSSFAKGIIEGMIYLFRTVAAWFMGISADLFSNVLDITINIIKQDAVYDGWVIARDFVNMFFILGLVIIAFATILRIETYGMKALLPKIIIIALLINFSFLICGIIIDTTHVITKFFINEGIKPSSSLIGRDLMNTINQDKPGEVETLMPHDWYVAMVVEGAQTLMMFITGFILLIGVVLLLIRMAGLWILIILAPFAWFLGIFPKFKDMNTKWWNNFLKYAFFAPIYVFFLYLGLKIVNAVTINTINIAGAGSKFLDFVASMTQYSLAVIIFGGAPMVAMSMGIYGSRAVIGAAKGALKGTTRIPLKLQKAATTMVPPAWMEKGIPPLAKLVRGVQKTAAFTSPEFWKKAMEARKADRQRKARKGYIIGKQQDVLNRVFSFFSEKTNFAEQAEQFEVAEKKKDIEAETKRVGPRLIAKLEEALKQRDVLTYKAVMELLQEQGDTNDAMISDRGLFDDLKFDDKYALGKLKGLNVNDKGVDKDGVTKRRFSNLGFKHGTIQQMRQMGLSDKQIAPFLGKLQEIALQAGYYGSYGMVDTDDKGNVAIASDEDQIKVAAAKLRTQPARSRKLHGTAIGMQGVDEKGQYKFVGRDDVDDALLEAYTQADVEATELRYVRPDAQISLNQAYEQGALKGISVTADALGEKVNDAMTGKTATKAGKKAGKKAGEEAGEEAGEKTKEEVKKELEDLGLPK